MPLDAIFPSIAICSIFLILPLFWPEPMTAPAASVPASSKRTRPTLFAGARP
jgi:hypothetical protein